MAQCKCGEESYGRQSTLYNIDNDELNIFLPRRGGENIVTTFTLQENNFPELFFLRNVLVQVSVDLISIRFSENEPALIPRKRTKTGLYRAAEIYSNVCGDKEALPICFPNLTPLNSTLSST